MPYYNVDHYLVIKSIKLVLVPTKATKIYGCKPDSMHKNQTLPNTQY